MKDNWLYRILNYNATPPDGVWDNIADNLNKEEKTNAADYTSKILDYEVSPPDAALTNIFAALDENETNPSELHASEKILQYTQVPPLAAWENIAAILDNKKPADIIPLKDKKNNLKIIYRIAVAAVVLAVILMPIFLNIKKHDAEITPVAKIKSDNKSISLITDTNNTTGLTANGPAAQKSNTPSTNTKPNTSKTTYAIPDTIEYIKGNEVADLAPNPEKLKKEKLKNTSGQTPEDIGLINTPNTYISITGPDGQSIKISSKFSNLVSYLNEQNPETIENIDIIIKESAQWRATFATWRNKMTNNTVAPSLGNFMDIIELSKVLEEKK